MNYTLEKRMGDFKTGKAIPERNATSAVAKRTAKKKQQ